MFLLADSYWWLGVRFHGRELGKARDAFLAKLPEHVRKELADVEAPVFFTQDERAYQFFILDDEPVGFGTSLLGRVHHADTHLPILELTNVVKSYQQLLPEVEALFTQWGIEDKPKPYMHLVRDERNLTR